MSASLRIQPRGAACSFIAALVLLALAAPSRADEARADTTLDRFLGTFSDSTDAYFGPAAAPLDSAGLDSALTYGLENPRALARRGQFQFNRGPDLGFNRVDGPVWGARAAIGRPRMLGALGGRLRYAAGPNLWLGGAAYERVWRARRAFWRVNVLGGRSTDDMDRTRRDQGESSSPLADLSALIGGQDPRRFLRRDGWEARLSRSATTWSIGASWRDMLESPRAVTAGWNLRHSALLVPDNLPAAFGRAHEATFDATLRTPGLPLFGEATYSVSRRAMGSDFEYRRTRFALAGNFGLGRIAALVPQVAYGRLVGEQVPQAAFYLGGARMLGRFDSGELGGSGLAIARIDLLGAQDVLALAHIPHPATFPLQLGVHAASGAVWGVDPYGGATRPGVDWPDRAEWRSETGASLIYQPGIPDPTSMLRLDVIWPVGAGSHETRIRVGYTRAMGLLRAFED